LPKGYFERWKAHPDGRSFPTETSESLDTVDNQLVRFDQDPNNAKIAPVARYLK
jgi:hypothetical protein